MKSVPTEKLEKRDAVIQAIRHKIVRGKFRPGLQLPPRSKFEEDFGVSRFTMQQVFDQLRDDGFIRVNGRRATYVAEHPPHLTHYALLFPTEPSSDPWVWPQSWQALIHEANVLQRQTPRTIHRYYNIHDGADHPRFRELHKAIRTNRLAGLVFTNRSAQFGERTSALSEPGVPGVAITSDPTRRASMPLICRSYGSLFDRALKHVAQEGRRRVATVMTPWCYEQSFEELQTAAQRHGVMMRPYWTQIVHPSAPHGAKLAMQMLFSVPPSDRPDALLVADDNLLEPSLSGLLAASVRVPDEVGVVAHTAFPCNKASLWPITRIGFSAGEVLRRCIEQIDQQRRGEVPPPSTVVPAIFEHEYVVSGGGKASEPE